MCNMGEISEMYSEKEAFIKKYGEGYPHIKISEQAKETLFRPIKLGKKEVANRIVFQPMEGCDGTATGCPAELTERRYLRFAESGAGMIWLEAVAVSAEGRANPRQLYLTEKTMPSFAGLVEQIKERCLKVNGYEPVVVFQATHSGRYSKPKGVPEPVIAYNNPIFEKNAPLSTDRIISDEACDELPEKFAVTASLARRCGFDGIDVKCCHRYLLSEFLSAYERSGKYGGDFSNRTRLYLRCIEGAKTAEREDFFVTSRLNVYDGFPYPYGFGVSQTGTLEADLTEPEELIGILYEKYGLRLLNITVGNPYVNPHVNRPFYVGPYANPEKPVQGVERIAAITGALQKKFPQVNMVLSGTSALREYAAAYGAGMIEDGSCALAGFGRMTFAYPEFVHDLIETGHLRREKCCVACSKCSALMRAGKVAGCPVFDREVYSEIYKSI